MIERERGFDQSSDTEKLLAEKITSIVDWLAVVEKPDHVDGQAVKLGYYDAPQMGPILHGGLYFGRHRVYYGEVGKEWNEWCQISVLYPDSYAYSHGESIMSVNAENGRVHAGDNGYSEFTEQTITHFIDWLTQVELRLTDRTDQHQ